MRPHGEVSIWQRDADSGGGGLVEVEVISSGYEAIHGFDRTAVAINRLLMPMHGPREKSEHA